MVARIASGTMYLSRAVDHEGEVLDIVVQRGRDKAAALKLMRKLLKKQGFAPTVIVTDKLRSYAAAFAELGLAAEHERGLRQNNRAEVSHQPVRRRERPMRHNRGAEFRRDPRARRGRQPDHRHRTGAAGHGHFGYRAGYGACLRRRRYGPVQCRRGAHIGHGGGS